MKRGSYTRDSLSERYKGWHIKGRQILEFKSSLGQNLSAHMVEGMISKTGSHPTSLLSVLTKSGRSLNSFVMLRKMCLLSFPMSQGVKLKRNAHWWDSQEGVLGG